MEEPFTVTIGHGGAFLRLSRGDAGPGDFGGRALWSLTVEVEDEGLKARTSVLLGPDRVEPPLSELFDEIAASWRGWHGTKDWDGMEGGLTLSCTHDGPGHIAINVELRHLSGAGWVVRTVVRVDAGQLDEIAAEVRRLLAVA